MLNDLPNVWPFNIYRTTRVRTRALVLLANHINGSPLSDIKLYVNGKPKQISSITVSPHHTHTLKIHRCAKIFSKEIWNIWCPGIVWRPPKKSDSARKKGYHCPRNSLQMPHIPANLQKIVYPTTQRFVNMQLCEEKKNVRLYLHSQELRWQGLGLRRAELLHIVNV